jgi:MYXO-CTERM domain-containing protein
MFRVVLALLVVAGVARANGRSPQTIGVYPKPGEPQTLYLATTFGLLETKDEGCTFRWMCEQNIGYGGTWDPHYAIGSDGTIFATTYEGLRISRDGGCSFETATASLPMADPNRIADIWIDALDIGPTGEVWVGTAETGHSNDVFVSADNGATFAPRGMMSPEIWWKSVKVAPTNPAIVYISGYQVAGTPTAYAFRTSNGGMQWTPSPLTGVQYAATPVLRIKAVDPIDPDVVYMASEGANPPGGDRLYRSADGGMTWTEVLATSATVHDVVIRDGTHVVVATQIRTTSSVMGGPAYQSSNAGMSFEPMTAAPQLACVAKRADGTLFGCGANWDPDFKAMARSTDGGATWEKVWRFVEIAGAVQCTDGTVQRDTCELALWDCPSCSTDLKRQFGAKGPACGAQGSDPPVPPPKKGCCSAGSGGPTAMVSLLLVFAAGLTRRRRS